MMKTTSRPDNPDFVIVSSDNHRFSLHSPILQLRWPLFKRDSHTAKNRLESLDSNSITAIIEYIYGGLPVHENMREAFKIAEVPFPITANPSVQYKADMQRLFSSHSGSDFIIESYGERIHVHKFVLAIRSGYFASLFNSGLAETNNGIYVDSFAESSERMKQFIEYLYVGSVKCHSIDDNIALLVLCKAFYLFENYEGEVEEYILSNILRLNMNSLNEVMNKAKSRNLDKLMDLIDACESFA